ncbi:hypothetical protein MASR2M50_23300 [Thauera sp.]
MQSVSSGALLMPSSSSSPANLSSPWRAKRPDSASWSADSTCTFQCFAFEKAARLRAFFARLHSTSGGFSETELKLLAVMPMASPSAARVVMMVTPVVKVPSAARNAWGSKPVCVVMICLAGPEE